MKIFIPRLPEATTRMELRRFAEAELELRLSLPFTQKARIITCDILRIADDQGIVEYHGLLTVMPDRAGEWLVSHLMGARFNGKLIVAREYVDRRRSAAGFEPEYDRRRSGLRISRLGHVGTQALA